MTPSLNTTPPFLKNRLRRYEVNGYTFDMIKVEKGTFRMGGEDNAAFDWEKPVHEVTLEDDFEIGKYPVTQGLWQAVMGSAWQEVGFEGMERPVERVSWEDICGRGGFLEKLNAALSVSGDGVFALPTEAQWEYAARGGRYGGDTGYIYAGSGRLKEVGWYDKNSGAKTHAVGRKQSNLLGLYDMNGNVWEWCSDRYGAYPSGTRKNPKGPTEGARRVNRGGSWEDDARICRVSWRNAAGLAPTFRHEEPGRRAWGLFCLSALKGRYNTAKGVALRKKSQPKSPERAQYLSEGCSPSA